MVKEVWRDIPNFKGIYQVSSYGRVRSLNRYVRNSLGRVYFYHGKILKPHADKRDHVVIGLSKHQKMTWLNLGHLVARVFLNNPNHYANVMHKDDNPKNNHADNLKWASNYQIMHSGQRMAHSKHALETYHGVQVILAKGSEIHRFKTATWASKWLKKSEHLSASLESLKSEISLCCREHRCNQMVHGWFVFKATLLRVYLQRLQKRHVKSLPNEQWKPIKHYEKYYQISDFGRIKRTYGSDGHHFLREHLVTPDHQDHYYQIPLYKHNRCHTYQVGQLVAQAFIPNPKRYKYVDHLDGNATNNQINNLRWCEANHTYLDRIRNQKTAQKLSKPILIYNQKIRKSFPSLKQGAKWVVKHSRFQSVSNVKSYLSACCHPNNQRKTVNGFYAKYLKKN